MLALCIRTDKPTSELYVYDGDQELSHVIWEAHRELANTLHLKIQELLVHANTEMQDFEKVVVYEGPGSFTGLRIGISVANALAYGLSVPVVSVSGDSWIKDGVKTRGTLTPVQPVYGSAPHITKPRK